MKSMNEGNLRLTLVISSLLGGGAERILSTMANYWADKGWLITLLTLVHENEPQHYELHPDVNYRAVGIASSGTNPMFRLDNIQRILRLRHAICENRPHGIISFLDKVNILTLLTTIGLNIPVIVSERIDPEDYPIGRVWKLLRFITYHRADRVVVQTERARDYFSGFIHKHTVIIPNPVVVPFVEPDSIEIRPAYCHLVAMGRLMHQKGFDILLKAFAKIKGSYPDWRLTILGEGVLRTELESLRNNLGLGDSVRLPGWVNNPYEYLKEADIFVLPSRYEGFPNALCEAMAFGLPVIAADCPSGPREITGNGVSGILIPPDNVDALANALDSLMGGSEKRKVLARLSLAAAQTFNLETIMELWERLLMECAPVFRRK